MIKQLLPILFFIAGFFLPTHFLTAQNPTDKWDPAAVQKTIEHIFAKGKKTGPDEMKFILPVSGYLLLQGAPDNAILTLISDTLEFSVFLSESKNFKGNLFNGKYGARYSLSDLNKFTAIVAKFLADFSKKKPNPPIPLVKGTDPLTLQYLAWVKKLQAIGTKTKDGYEFEKNWEVGDSISNRYNVTYAVSECTESVYIYTSFSSFNYASGNDENDGLHQVHIRLNPDRPILSGTYQAGDNIGEDDDLPITAGVLQKIFSDPRLKK